MWNCGCESFLLSRFLLCEHIVHCYERPKDPNNIFRIVRRQQTGPFWVHPQLILHPEFQLNPQVFMTVNKKLSEELNEEATSESESGRESLEEDKPVEMNEDPTESCDISDCD